MFFILDGLFGILFFAVVGILVYSIGHGYDDKVIDLSLEYLFQVLESLPYLPVGLSCSPSQDLGPTAMLTFT